MVCFSDKGGCGRHKLTHIEAFKIRAGWLGLEMNGFELLVLQCYLKQLYHYESKE